MRLVPKPVTRPGHCAVLPYLGQTAQDEQWVDTGSEMPGFDNHVYISSTAVREMAALLGYPTIKEHEQLAEANRMALELLDEMNARVEASSALEEAVAIVRAAANTPPKVKVAA